MKRFELIDTIRGLAVLSMIGYHACWLINYFGLGIKTQTLFGPEFWAWERSICVTFILISGYSFSLGRRHLKNAVTVFTCGLLITAITCIFIPDIRIIFGVLTLLGSSMFIANPVDKAFNRFASGSKKAGFVILVLCAVLFAVTYRIPEGYMGFAPDMAVRLPEALYKGCFMTYLGFMEKGFFSADYFPLIPWLFLYLCGYFLHKTVQGTSVEERVMPIKIPGINIIGRHSLLIYLIHPVVLYLVMAVISIKTG